MKCPMLHMRKHVDIYNLCQSDEAEYQTFGLLLASYKGGAGVRSLQETLTLVLQLPTSKDVPVYTTRPKNHLSAHQPL